MGGVMRPLLLALVLLAATVRAEDTPVWRQPDLPLDRRVDDLLSQLTLEEKASLLDHNGPGAPRLGISADFWNQCLHGVAWDGGPTTLFPIPTGMAATWDPALVHHVADVISDEARAIYNAGLDDPNFHGQKKGLIYRSPVINILRNPYWGRDAEAWSEDPFLCGRMAVAFVQGLQGNDPHYLKLASTLKHYAVNNVETNRTSLSAKVSEAMLRDYWLPHFRDAIVEGRARSIMASYNQINGVHNVYNHFLLTDILKGDWGFDGFVVSDLGGVHDESMVVQAVNAGCDFSDKEFRNFIPDAVRTGRITETRLNEALGRVLRVRFQLGEFDPADRVPWRKLPFSVVCAPEHRELSRQTSRESLVLLKNDGGQLPLDRAKLHKLAVIGGLAQKAELGDPSYIGKSKRHVVNILDGLRDLAPGLEILPAPDDVAKAVEAAQSADAAIVCVGTTRNDEREGHDRQRLGLSDTQEKLVEAVYAANPHTVVVLLNAGPLTVPWIKEHIPAILGAWWSGEEQGHAVAEALFGDFSPGGRLPYTVYASAEQVPPQDEYDISRGFTYMYLRGAPLFAFGHGLSYTTFQYSEPKLLSSQLTASDTLQVSLDITNTGAKAGDEVVQLYTHTAGSSPAPRPAKALHAFARVSLAPGEKRSVTLSVPCEKLGFWDEQAHGFRIERGAYEAMVGSSSEDIRQRTNFTLQ